MIRAGGKKVACFAKKEVLRMQDKDKIIDDIDISEKEKLDEDEKSILDSGEKEFIENGKVYPCIPLRGVSIFPHTMVHFDVGREKSIKALEKAMEDDRYIFVSTQKDPNVLIPTFEDIYEVGSVVKIKQMLKISGDAVRVLVSGVRRARIKDIITEDEFLSATLDEYSEEISADMLSIEEQASIRVLIDKFIEYAAIKEHIQDDVVDKIISESDPAALVDRIAQILEAPTSRKQMIIDAFPFSLRVARLTEFIVEENAVSKMEQEISQKVKDNIDKNQKDYFLKERMNVIRDELGDGEDAEKEAEEWIVKLDKLKLDKKIDEKVRKEIKRFTLMAPSSAESAVIRNYIETILDLPWRKSSRTNSNIGKAREVLDKDHYGLEKVKERILEYLSVIHLSKEIKGPILCLVGPPGTGKTSIAKSIARATGRNFIRMSLGGVRDEAEIRGHRRTYIGAIPGRVITEIKESGTNNPVFLFDEIDKVGADYKGDPSSALLEVLDPEQNKTFTDHFLEIPFDLSKVMFITTANTVDTIPGPLLDRMEVISLSGYTEEEKVNIASRYLIPKKIKEHGLKNKNLTISENAVRDIINYYTRESGVRNLEREIAKICRRTAMQVVETGEDSFSVTRANLEKYLDKKRFRYDKIQGESEIGVVTGMAWTRVGGDTLEIESAVLPGTGRLQLTGQLGDVMKESAKTGVSYIRSIADELGLEKDFYKKYDLHIHVPEGAVPKDGPSAGVTIFTSVVSALTKTPVKKDVAMTGEITLRGRVLPVGGIKEKVLAAHRAGIKTILLPEENMKDIDEIPNTVKKKLKFIPLRYAKEVMAEALCKK